MSGLFAFWCTRALAAAAVAIGAGLLPSSALAQAPRETKSPADGHVENFGQPAVDLLRKAARVEAFRLLPLHEERGLGRGLGETGRDKPKPLRPGPRIDGHLILRTAGSLPQALANDFRVALLHPDLAFVTAGNKLCGGFQPGIALRLTDGAKQATVLLCFACHDVKTMGDGHSAIDMGGAGFELLRLSAQAFPDDEPLARLLREESESRERRRKFNAAIPAALLPMLDMPDLFSSLTTSRSRNRRTGRLVQVAPTEGRAEDDRVEEMLDAIEPEPLAKAILLGLGTQDLDWVFVDRAARVLVGAAFRLGGRRMMAALRELPADPDAAAGAARLVLWEGLPVEPNQMADLVARIDAAAAAHRSQWDDDVAVALLASSGHPGVGEVLMKQAELPVLSEPSTVDGASKPALAAIGAALVDPIGNAARLRALRFVAARDQEAHRVALAVVGDGDQLRPEIFGVSSLFVRGHALDAIVRFDGTHGMPALCTTALDAPSKHVVRFDAIEAFQKIVRSDWSQAAQLGRTEADVKAIRAWWAKSGAAFVEARRAR